MAKLDQQVTALATMSPAQSREEWTATIGGDPPDFPVSMLRRGIAYWLQVEALGSLPLSAQRMLDIVADGVTPLPDPPIRLKPGSRLLREWNGKFHTVTVEENGFRFDDRHFASLSHIAREITGAHWSGPRFFGLKRRSSPPRQGGQIDG